jgi:hypothetical protein
MVRPGFRFFAGVKKCENQAAAVRLGDLMKNGAG